MNVITVDNVSKTYKLYDSNSDRLKEALDPLRRSFSTDFHALSNVSFSIEKGETIGIIGRNGSGKSTLLQILCGISQPSTGTVHTEGRISALLELGTGFNPEFSGRENIYLNASILGLDRPQIDLKLDQIIEFADIGEFIDQPVKTYSSGMYVRLAFSIQAHVDPEILVVDEALAVGDAQFVHKCMLRFHELQQQGTTIILVTHDASSVKNLCSRAIWLHQGQVKMDGDSCEVVDHYLEFLFDQDEFISTQQSSETLELSSELEESTLPDFDKRIGDSKVEIIGCALYNQNGRHITGCAQEDEIEVRLTIQNNHSHSLQPLVGCILKDFRGIEIASTVSRIENFSFPEIPKEGRITCGMRIKVPRLYPGTYSLTPSISYEVHGKDIIADRLVNALLFDVVAKWETHVTLCLPTHYALLNN